MGYLEQLFNLKGKIAAISGGGGYLCGAMALAFARAGCKVAVFDKNGDNAARTAQKISDEGGTACSAVLDVVDAESNRQALAFVLKRFGDVDILINGAGINAPTPFFDISLEEWHAILDTHITGTFLGCQIFGEYMVGHQKGSIVNMSSASSGPPLSRAFTYSVAKAGIKNLTQNLAREWAPYLVRVNALRPGFFPTEWSRKNFINPVRDRAIIGHTPMKRYGRPEELAGAVLWLCSDAAAFVTGSEVAVDGGFSCMTI